MFRDDRNNSLRYGLGAIVMFRFTYDSVSLCTCIFRRCLLRSRPRYSWDVSRGDERRSRCIRGVSLHILRRVVSLFLNNKIKNSTVRSFVPSKVVFNMLPMPVTSKVSTGLGCFPPG